MRKKLFMFLLFVVAVLASACSFNFEEPSKYKYNDFTGTEKVYLNKVCGELIPFLANDEYYFEAGNTSIKYYTIGNTEKDFEDYKNFL